MVTDCNKTQCVRLGGLWEGYHDSDRAECRSSSSFTLQDFSVLSRGCSQKAAFKSKLFYFENTSLEELRAHFCLLSALVCLFARRTSLAVVGVMSFLRRDKMEVNEAFLSVGLAHKSGIMPADCCFSALGSVWLHLQLFYTLAHTFFLAVPLQLKNKPWWTSTTFCFLSFFSRKQTWGLLLNILIFYHFCPWWIISNFFVFFCLFLIYLL